MKRKSGMYAKAGLGTLLLTVLFTIVSLTYDVERIGPEGSRVGFSTFNGKMFELIGYNERWYEISDVLGKIAFVPLTIFALMGLFQLIKTRNLFKVDPKIRALGVFYVIIGIIYLVFTVVAVNYRPVIIDGGLEPSYPSSHTVQALSIFVTAPMMVKLMMENTALITLISITCYALAAFSVCARIISGVHWMTDIFAGIMLSISLIFFLKAVLERQQGR